MDIIPGLISPLSSENPSKEPEFSSLIGDTIKGIFSPAVKASLDVDIGVKKDIRSLVDHSSISDSFNRHLKRKDSIF